MKYYRKSKGETEHYTSLEELRDAWGLKPITKQTKDMQKLNKQKDHFLSKHLCSACKQPMVYIGGNQMVCQNENCKGIKHELKTDVETKVWYTPSFDLLDEKGAEVAHNIFQVVSE